MKIIETCQPHTASTIPDSSRSASEFGYSTNFILWQPSFISIADTGVLDRERKKRAKMPSYHRYINSMKTEIAPEINPYAAKSRKPSKKLTKPAPPFFITAASTCSGR